jgi:adenylate kinase
LRVNVKHHLPLWLRLGVRRVFPKRRPEFTFMRVAYSVPKQVALITARHQGIENIWPMDWHFPLSFIPKLYGLALNPKGFGAELVPDDVMLRVVDHALDAPEVRERGYLLDGFPRTVEQAAAFLDGNPTRLDAAIDLDLPADEARRRLLARGRADDDPAVIDHRLALDAAEAAPLLELLDRAGLLRRIDGCGTEDEVFARILEALGRE